MTTDEPTAPDPSMVLFRAELFADPLPYTEDVTYELSWTIERVEDIDLHAGVAELRPSGRALTAEFDYSDVAQLVGCAVPFGRVVVDESDDDDPWTQLIEGGSMNPTDSSLVTVLFGADFVAHLHRSNFFTVAISPQPSWATLGRIALGQSTLRRQHHPIEGLWSLELASLVGQLRAGSPLEPWREELLFRAGPALAVLDAGWTDRFDAASLNELRGLVDHIRAQDSARDLGPLATHLLGKAEDELMDELENIVNRASVELTAQPTFRGVRPVGGNVESDLVYMGATRALQGREESESIWQPAQIDAEAHEFGVLVAEWKLTDSRLAVRVEGGFGLPTGLLARTSVRVTTGPDHLVAGSSGLAFDPATETFTAELLVPEEVDQSDLTVVVGRDLPMEPCDIDRFNRRQHIREGQDRIDAERLGQADAVTDHTIPNRPFVAEMLRRGFSGGDDVVPTHQIDSGDSWALSGARSLAATLGREAEAASWERKRRLLNERLDELGIDELELLALAAARAADRETANTLLDGAQELMLTDL